MENRGRNERGIAVDHRSLLSALGSGWLTPPESAPAPVLEPGVYTPVEGGYPRKAAGAVPVYVRVALDLLPQTETGVRTPDGWKLGLPGAAGRKDAVHWRGPIPAWAFTGLAVNTKVQAALLQTVAGATSNIGPDDVLAEVDPGAEAAPVPGDPPPVEYRGIGVKAPEEHDAAWGSACALLAATPGDGGWVSLTGAALGPDGERTRDAAHRTGAPWWRFTPWAAEHRRTARKTSADECLWCAAVDVLGSAERGTPKTAAAKIRDAAAAYAPAEVRAAGTIDGWYEGAVKLIRADAALGDLAGGLGPAGTGIVLALVRQRPGGPAGWRDGRKDRTAAVLSAEALCGLMAGYSGCPRSVRGTRAAQHALGLFAARCCSPALGLPGGWAAAGAEGPTYYRSAYDRVVSWKPHGDIARIPGEWKSD